jgi:non-ribosomal peptide synthetase component F
VVDKHPHDSLVDLTLSLRGDHGPAVAASTLVQLAAHYLALPSASTSLDTESNLEGTELLPAPSQLNFPPMPASPVPAHLSTAVDFQQPKEPVLLHTAFEKRVSQTPNAPAVDYLFTSCDVDQSVAHRTLTYEEVKFQAVSVAHYVNLLVQELHWKATWGKQRVIPVLLPPCPELYICVLGILKAGHAFCPLPLDAPVQRIRDILDDIQAPAILGLGTSPWINPEIKPSHSPDCPPGREMVWVDILNMQDWEAKTSNIMRPVDPKGPYHVPTAENALAYVLYTSGSTGKPKGVLVSHHSVVCAISSYVSHMPHLPTGSQLRWFQMTSPTFGIFLLDMFLPLGLGGTLCTAERVMILTDVETAVDKLQALATFSIASFAMLFRPDRMPLLKTVVSGGEILNRRVIENYSKDCNLEQDRFLLNIHGPTVRPSCFPTNKALPVNNSH